MTTTTTRDDDYCPSCGALATLSDTRIGSIEFTAPLCDPCREDAVRDLTMDDFDRAYARATANGWSD